MVGKLLTVTLFLLSTMLWERSLARQSDFHQRITPNVSQRETAYDNIVLHSGDVIHIEAGGCVQTGGEGLTWKRYVNPSGEEADHLYHGLISIPGITSGLQRIEGYLNQNLVIPEGAGGVLKLGYEDKDYDDNGYANPDNGTDNQCAGEQNAYVDITIKRAVAEQTVRPDNTPDKQPRTTLDDTTPEFTNPGITPDSSTAQSTGKPFFETVLGMITAVTGLILAIVGLVQVFKKK